MLFAAKNLVDPSMEPCVPWEFNGLDKLPKGVLTDKAERTRWLQNPQTVHQCFSTWEGVNNRLRISSGKGGDEGNPPRAIHAFFGDYDLPLQDAEIDFGLQRMGDLRPNYVETTLSGNCGLLWIFEKPLGVPSYEFARFLMARIEELLPVNKIGGIDTSAAEAPERLFTNGCRWRLIHDKPVPWDRILGWMVKSSEKFDWKTIRGATVIPLEALKPELAKRYPKFPACWPSDFTLDSRGPTFWVEGSKSPMSATVRATGISTFSDTAHKPFFHWSELVGAEFVKNFETCELGKAVDGVYYDGKSFIRQSSTGHWIFESRDDFTQFLRTERGLSDKREKGATYAKTDEAVMFVKNHNHVEGAGSFAFYPKGLIIQNSRRFLNTHKQDALAPASSEAARIAVECGFPWIKSFLSEFFSSPVQLDYFISWLAHFYKGCYYRKPSPGQNVVLVGGTGLGKTFLMRKIIGALVGGFTEAKEWIYGQTTFNSDLFENALWCIDDGGNPKGANGHRAMSEAFKRLAANDSFYCNEKFRKGSMVSWSGRAMMSCNTDAESIRNLPNMDLSNQEKINLFLVNSERSDGFQFPEDRAATAEIVARELPFFARFLLDYVTPEHCRAESGRFGVAHYHEPSLLTSANQASNNGTITEIIHEWMRRYFTVDNPNADSWCGSGLQFHQEVLRDPSLTEAMRPYPVQTLTRALSALAEKRVFKIVVRNDGLLRMFEIFRDERYPKRPVRKETIPQTENPKFQKAV